VTRRPLLALLCLLLCACTALRELVSPAWRELRSGELAILTQGPVEPAEELLRRLRWLGAIAAEVSGLPAPPPRALNVVLFESHDEYVRYSPRPRFAGTHARLGSGSVALVDGSGPWSATARIALHEYTHYFLAQHGTFPAWYEEGLADYLATLRIEDGWIELGQTDPLRMNLLRGRGWMPLLALVSAGKNSPEYEGPSLLGRFHDTAWSLFHYLRLGRPQGRQALTSYLASVRAGKPSAPALEEATGTELLVLQQELARYVARSPLPRERLETRRFRIARPEVVTRLIDASEAAVLRSNLDALRTAQRGGR